MARIRSVHPSLFTDEAWVSCSPLARVLYIGLWTDADDQGVFEWKPLQIKMRLLPGDMADAPTLLGELSDAGLIATYDVSGRRYGAIKQFRKYQRPKKPNALHPLPAAWRDFVCLSDPSSEPEAAEDDEVPNHFPTEGEIAPQMEDGGEKEEEDANASLSPEPADKTPQDVPDQFEACWKAYPHIKGRSSRPKALRVWRGIPASIKPQMLGAIGRFAREGREPKAECGAAGMHVWLRDEKYRDWLAGSDPPALAPVAWNGPEAVREAFLAAMREDWVRSYLDPCTWQDVPERGLIPATATAGRKLVNEGRAVLNKLGLVVMERAA